MTYSEIDAAMVALTREQCAACEKKLAALSGNAPTERKAIQLELGIYTFCGNAGLLFNATSRDHWLGIRRPVVERMLPRYPRLQQIYHSLEEEEKPRFLAAVTPGTPLKPRSRSVRQRPCLPPGRHGVPNTTFFPACLRR